MAAGLLLAAFGCAPEPDAREAVLRLGRPDAFEGRLAGTIGLPPGPIEAPEARRLRRVLRDRTARLAAEGDLAETAALQGLKALLAGRYGEAQAGFRSAGLRDDDWRPWNDLAVASLERARVEDRPLDLLRALAAVQRAAEIAPERPEVRFNFALALSKLHLRYSATAAWREFLEVAAAPEAASEAAVARRRLARLEAPTRMQLFERRVTALEERSPPGEAAWAELAEEFPDLARIFAERRLTARWGRAVEDGDPAAADGAEAVGSEIGSALARRHGGDHLVEDLFSAFAECRRRSDAGRGCARSARAFAEGVGAFYAGDLARAETDLARVDGGGGGGTPEPLRRLADFYRAYARFQLALPGARADFERQLSPAVERRYPSLAGWIHWRLGVVEVSLGRNQQAREHYLRGRELIASGSSPEEAVYACNLLAEAFDLIGDVERAWRCRLELFAVKAYSGEGRTVHAMLTTAVLGLLAQGEHGAAGALLDELVEQDLETGQPEYLAEAYRTRAEYRAPRGDWRGALDDVARARSLLNALGSSVRGRHIARTLDLVEAAARAATDPAGAEDVLSAPLAFFESTANSVYKLRTVELRARILERLGVTERAFADWMAAIEMHEAQRPGVEDVSRPVALTAAQEAYDAALAIAVERSERPDHAAEALTIAERARARYLLDLLGSAGGRLAEPSTAAEIVAGVPTGTALVEYAVLERQLVAWVVEAGGLRMVRSPIAAERLARLVATLWADVGAGLPEAALRTDAAALHEALIEPLDLDLGALDRVVFVPDRDLVRVPFAALFDRRRERYLIEDVAVAGAPSASLFLAPAPTARRLGPELVVAAPLLDGAVHRGLPPLPGALAEAAALAAIYPGATVLTGREATPEAFVGALRDARLLHFAGHARANADRVLNSELLLARSGEHGGRLTLADLLAAGVLGPPVVVLSACRTADGFAVDREGPLGLAAGFVATGSRAVLSTLWEIDDGASPALLASFHRGLAAGTRPSEAWRRAVVDRLHGPDARFETWAPFNVSESAAEGQP